LYFMNTCSVLSGGHYDITSELRSPTDGSFFPWFDAFEFKDFNQLALNVFFTARCNVYYDRIWVYESNFKFDNPISPGELDIGSLAENGERIQVTLVNVELTVSDAENSDRTATSKHLSKKITIYIPETLEDGKSTGKATIRIAASKLEPDSPAAGAHSLWAIKGGPVEGASEGSFAEKTHAVVLKPGEDRKYLVSAGVDMDENGVLDEPHEVSREIEVIIPKITSLYIEDPDDVPTPPGESVTVEVETFPEGRPVVWEIVKEEGDVKYEINQTEENIEIIAYQESGSGWVYIRAADAEFPSIYKEAKVYIGCPYCENDGDYCNELEGGGFVGLSSIDVRF
ncbi:MAG: hypothetical protein GY859_21665, partial [Desulfobacterales bacterium]|nr:hypothetical protein [Desulfobacterales bacterium]